VHPYHVKVIATSVVKTDKRDTLALARLLAANLLRSIWVPPAHVRELRRLVKHRQQLVSQRAIIRNRLRSVLHTYNLHPPEGEVFSTDHFTWWHSLELPPSVQLQVRHDLTLFECFSALIQDVDGALARLSVSPDWADQVPFIMQLPGVGLITAMTILGAIGDITRFPTPKQLVGYSGLGARVYASGQTFRTGRITKTGRRELRTAMVEVAWGAVRCHPHWRARFERLAARKGKKKAIVAIARSLLVVLWHVLTHREADRDADPQAVARKFLDWGSRHGLATSLGLSRQQFVDYRIQRVGLAKEARSIPA
jgi:transposase